MVICLAALALKIAIPGGYMLSADQGRLAVTVCRGVAPSTRPTAMPRMHGAMKHHAPDAPHGQDELPCAFAGLSHQALGAVDPILLVAAIAFIMAFGIAPVPPTPIERRDHLRPPLRGPPRTA
jgi:hypothetical protein